MGRVSALQEEARAFYGDGRLEEAADRLREALRLDPDDPESRHLLGVVVARLGDLEGGGQLIEAAIALAPAESSYHVNLGNVRQASGDLEGGAACFRRAVDLAPWNALARFNLARLLDDLGDAEGAAAEYRQAIETAPCFADAHNNLATVLETMGRREEAIESYRRAVELEPDSALFADNLGKALQKAGRQGEAERWHRTAIGLAPGNASSHRYLGDALLDMKRPDEAEECYRTALALDPGLPDVHNNMGHILEQRHRYEEAEASYRACVGLEPGHKAALTNLGQILFRLGRMEEARQTFRLLLASHPDSPVARHMVAATTGEGVEDRAPDDYVQQVFDGFAAVFDEKLAELDYRAPSLIAKLLADSLGAPEGTLAIADLGCGTGLCGPFLRPYARILAGVDLSPRMLDKAREREVYDDLLARELTSFLEEEPARFDLLIAADTLVYFGALGPVLGAAARSLKKGGRFVFTLEEWAEEDAEGFVLTPSGRYAHPIDDVVRLLAGAGFADRRIAHVHLRVERGVPVAGLLVDAGL
ncbi:tetratricopeptide repeat protein [Inquilinus sp. CAU 1745]|uniref:tetratricopeptide repeat protein n=1 Tax=Inquilinus sp. CAU 1745 TaxID=3140369 RepID=UPI00325BD3C4